jgi:hypothetical protein
MPRLTPLPESLRYLEPFRKQVAKVKPEEIDENVDVSLLNQLLLERIQGIPINKGKEKLMSDSEVLETWLSSPGVNDNGGMTFLHGYLMALPELVDCLLEEKDKPVWPQQEIRIDFPAEAKLKKMPGGLLKVTWLRTTIFLLACDKEYRDYRIKEFREGPSHKLSKVSVTQVKFGNVTGWRRFVDFSIVGSMNVDYALEIPVGYAEVTLLKKGTAIDPPHFEQFFHTLRIT